MVLLLFLILISIFLRIINLIYIRTCDFGVHWLCFGLFVWFEFFGIGLVCECAIRQRDAVGVLQQHQQLFYNKLFFLRNGNSQRARASRNKQQNKNEQLKIGGEDKCQRGASERGDGMSGTETEII